MFICAGSRVVLYRTKTEALCEGPYYLHGFLALFSTTTLILRINSTGQISREYGSDARTAYLKRLAPPEPAIRVSMLSVR